MSSVPRSRYWASILYQESAKENFIEVLKEQHISFLLSPLHDADVDSDGVLKKAHWHLMLCFDGPTTQQVASILLYSINGVGCERVNSSNSYARYLCHLDDPDKAQYSPDDVIAYGTDYASYIVNSDTKYENIGGVLQYCLDNRIASFSGLLLSTKNNAPILFKTVCDNAYLIKNFLVDFRNVSRETVQKGGKYEKSDDFVCVDSNDNCPFYTDDGKS